MLTLFRRFAVIGIGAGLFAGVIVTLLQAFTTVPLIVAAEVYEQGASHEHEAQNQPARLILASADANLVLVHGDHAAAADGDQPITWQRRISTLAANLVAGAGFGLLLAGGMALAGHAYTPRTAALWGAAGFVTFALAPSLGLPPEVPGAVTAELAARQGWWIMTAIATGTGLWLILMSKQKLLGAAGLVLIVLPHLIGSPAAGLHGGAVPPELAAEFVTASLISQAVFWIVLGYAVGWLGEYLERRQSTDEVLQPA